MARERVIPHSTHSVSQSSKGRRRRRRVKGFKALLFGGATTLLQNTIAIAMGLLLFSARKETVTKMTVTSSKKSFFFATAFVVPSATAPSIAGRKSSATRTLQPHTLKAPVASIGRGHCNPLGGGPDTIEPKDRYEIATQLLDLVLERRARDIRSENNGPASIISGAQTTNDRRSGDIQALIEELTVPALKGNQPETYDPTECLFGGGFFCTLYFYYPNTGDDGANNAPTPEDPIWEKTSLLLSNIKGQQYYVRNSNNDNNPRALSVINYSEIWGPGFNIQADGDLTHITEENKSSNGTTLPDIYRVDATKISVSLFGGLISKTFDIEGSANLVVLYADPRLRIFVSPLPSKTRVGSWEQAGLVVVQVRSDLVQPKNESTPRVIDLRR
ncbi:unnamed protein product [Pseudo-nitzschia multistriata]|uniref:Uncharacterized protein n=1 Tax=Pseudo-nitzschia multistriata TaxID=183589 RepID=A0A448Z0N3_9STRA|nr:unnamed protein product [Pseudo-nitzschia multistriata]